MMIMRLLKEEEESDKVVVKSAAAVKSVAAVRSVRQKSAEEAVKDVKYNTKII